MSGIVGIVNFNQDAPISNIIGQMINILNHTLPRIKEVSITNNAAFAVLKLKSDCLHNSVVEDKDTVLAFWGYLWNKKDFAKKIKPMPDLENIPVGQLLLNLFKKEGLSSFYTLNGRFVIAIWNKQEKTLKLISDRHGFCKLFYWTSPKQFLFASEYKAIIWHEDFKKEIDEEALADFMALGYCLGNKTFFKNVKLLPHGSVLVFQQGKLFTERYWEYSFKNADTPLKEIDEYIHTYYELLTKAVKKQVEKKKL